MNVFTSWYQSRHLENVTIETMAPEELGKVLSKFYAEVKKNNGDDYEPESLQIMQSPIERYLKEKNYPLSIVRSREFHSSQEILNVKPISLHQQAARLISSAKTVRSLSHNHRRNEGPTSLSQMTTIEF